MTTRSWRPLRSVDFVRLSAASLQAHQAVQWLARAARAYVPAQPDDGHTNLGWDEAFGGLDTHALPGSTRLGLRIADLTLAVFDGTTGRPRHSLTLDGRRDADARAWLGDQVGTLGLDPHALDAPLPYPLPAPTIADGAPYATAGLSEFLDELAAWFSNANTVLNARAHEIAAQGLEVSPVRCWPHHFDLAMLVTVAPGRTTGVGFEPGDDYYDQPYFYVSLYPAPDVTSLPPLPTVGQWHTKDFTAAVAPARRILTTADQGAEVAAFLRAAVDIAITALR